VDRGTPLVSYLLVQVSLCYPKLSFPNRIVHGWNFFDI
jgi:hypothetical protein